MTIYELFIKHRENILNHIEIGASSGQICNMLNVMYKELDDMYDKNMEAVKDIHIELSRSLYYENDYWKNKYKLETLRGRE